MNDDGKHRVKIKTVTTNSLKNSLINKSGEKSKEEYPNTQVKYIHKVSNSSVFDKTNDVGVNIFSTTQRRGNSLSSFAGINFPSLNETKGNKISNNIEIMNMTNRVNLKKDVIKLYDQNIKKLKSDFKTLTGSTNFIPVTKENNALKVSGNFFNSSTSRSPLVSKPNKSHDIIIAPSNSIINSKLNQNLINNNGNNMNVYNELAKQLKNNKAVFRSNGYHTTNSMEKTKTEFKMLNNFNQVNNSVEPKASMLITNNKLNCGEKITSIGITKTTKDNSMSSTMRMTKINNTNEIEGPEELHLFYVNIFHNNKKLAYKFENSSIKNEEIFSEL